MGVATVNCDLLLEKISSNKLYFIVVLYHKNYLSHQSICMKVLYI